MHPTDSSVFWLALFLFPVVWYVKLAAARTLHAHAASRGSDCIRSHVALLFGRSLLAIATLITFRFMWFVLVLVALALNLINTIGYVKCKRDAGRKLTAIGGTVLTRGLEVWSGAQARMGGGGSAAEPA